MVQAKTDAEGGEVTSDEIWEIFKDEYLPAPIERPEDKWGGGGGRYELLSTRTSSDMTGSTTLTVKLRIGDEVEETTASGNGPIAAFLAVMADKGIEVELFDYSEHTLSAGGDAYAAAYVELRVNGKTLWGVGIDADISTASLKAVVSAVNRAIRTEAGDLELAAV